MIFLFNYDLKKRRKIEIPFFFLQVGGHWDMLLPKIDHIKEGLVRFFCLVPYDLITLEVWEKVMSHWIEAINKVGRLLSSLLLVRYNTG